MSIANLQINRPQPPAEEGETARIFRTLRTVQSDSGENRNDLAIVLITACILEGLNTRPRIVAALKQLDINPRHAAIILNKRMGSNPALHEWRRDENGVYHLLNDPT